MDATAKIKIFLVDDDIMFVEYLKHLLSEDRTEVQSFATGEECIKNLNQSPEIIILDYSFNNMLNGVQVLNRIKHVSPETEVIILSGIDNYSIKNDTIKYGAYDFIEKGESATLKIQKEVKQLCDDIESTKTARKENNRISAINVAIIVLLLVIFILTRMK